MAAASIRTAGVFLVLVMILFTYVGGLLLAVGDPHPGHRAPARLTPHTRRRCRRPRSR
jgi:hypothetical protein